MVKPSVGRVVHYVSYGTPGGEYGRECRAAVVTAVGPVIDHLFRAPLLALAVLNPGGLFFNQENRYDPGKPDLAGGTNLCGGLDYAGGSWHWPAKVEETP